MVKPKKTQTYTLKKAAIQVGYSEQTNPKIEQQCGIEEKHKRRVSNFCQSNPDHTGTQFDLEPLYCAIHKLSDALRDGRSVETIVQLNENLSQEVNKVPLGNGRHLALATNIMILNNTISKLQSITKIKQSELKRKNNFSVRSNRQTIWSHPVEKSIQASSSKYITKPLVEQYRQSEDEMKTCFSKCLSELCLDKYNPQCSDNRIWQYDKKIDPLRDNCQTEVRTRSTHRRLDCIDNIPLDLKIIYQDPGFRPTYSKIVQTYMETLSSFECRDQSSIGCGVDIVEPMIVEPCNSHTSMNGCWTHATSKNNSTNSRSSSLDNIVVKESTTERKQSSNKLRESKKERTSLLSPTETGSNNFLQYTRFGQACLNSIRRYPDISLLNEPPQKNQHQVHFEPETTEVGRSHYGSAKHSKHFVNNIVSETEGNSSNTPRDHGLPKNLCRHTPIYNQDEIVNSIWENTAKSHSKYNHDKNVCWRNAADYSPVGHFIQPGHTSHCRLCPESHANDPNLKYVHWKVADDNVAATPGVPEESTTNSVASDTDSAFNIQPRNTRKILNYPKTREQRTPKIKTFFSRQPLFPSNNSYQHQDNDSNSKQYNVSFNDFDIDSDESERPTTSSLNPRLFLRRGNTSNLQQK